MNQSVARTTFASTMARYGLQRTPHAAHADEWGGGDFDWVQALDDLQAAIDSGDQQAVQDVIDSAPSGSEQGYDDTSYTVITPDAPAPPPAAPAPSSGGGTVASGGWVQGSGGGWTWDANATSLYPATVAVTPAGTRYDPTTGSFLPVAVPVNTGTVQQTVSSPVTASGGAGMLSEQAIRLYNAIASANAWPLSGNDAYTMELVQAGILHSVGSGLWGPTGLTPAQYAAQAPAVPPAPSNTTNTTPNNPLPPDNGYQQIQSAVTTSTAMGSSGAETGPSTTTLAIGAAAVLGAMYLFTKGR